MCLVCGSVLDEPAHANHFTRLGIDPLVPFDAADAEARYIRLSRALHPDHHGGTDADSQFAAVELSAKLNEAYTTLLDEQRRHEYLLSLLDPDALEKHKTLAPDFLMEAMELSEELEDARTRGCRATIERIASLAKDEIDERMKNVTMACRHTMERIAAQQAHGNGAGGVPSRPLTLWNTDKIATLLHQARVYRRILRDTQR